MTYAVVKIGEQKQKKDSKVDNSMLRDLVYRTVLGTFLLDPNEDSAQQG